MTVIWLTKQTLNGDRYGALKSLTLSNLPIEQRKQQAAIEYLYRLMSSLSFVIGEDKVQFDVGEDGPVYRCLTCGSWFIGPRQERWIYLPIGPDDVCYITPHCYACSCALFLLAAGLLLTAFCSLCVE